VHPPTYGPPNHIGGIQVNHIFSNNHAVLALGLKVHANSSSFQGDSNLPKTLIQVMSTSGLHIVLDQSKDEETGKI
jgi:hypothetical protein